jgi:antitoxin ParD1/3/4
MSTMNISLPDQMRSFVEMQVNQGQYSSVSDYVRALIREDQNRRTREQIEAKLLEALESGKFEEVTPEFFEGLRTRARKAGLEGRESGSA